jgi:hypothetical protein
LSNAQSTIESDLEKAAGFRRRHLSGFGCVEGDVGMRTVPLGKLTSLISSGSTPLGGANVYLESGPVMLVRSQNVLMRKLNLDDVAFITE